MPGSGEGTRREKIKNEDKSPASELASGVSGYKLFDRQHRIVLEERAEEGEGMGRCPAVRNPVITVFKGTSRRAPSQHPPWGPRGAQKGGFWTMHSPPHLLESLRGLCPAAVLGKRGIHWKEAANTKTDTVEIEH